MINLNEMPNNYLVYILLLYIVVREVIYQVSLHRLINKIMSRNYYDYAITEKMVNLKQEVKPKETPQALEEDLSYIGI